MSKLLAGVIAALIVGVGVAAASSLNSSNDPVRTGNTISTSDDATGTTTDVRTTTTTGTGVDISGPCDEAEHADDPRCTDAGAGPVTDDRGDDVDDHRGRGDDNRGHRGGDDDHGGDEDRSGSNSGSDDSGSDDSGHGSDD
jgi:hypothetical protein